MAWNGRNESILGSKPTAHVGGAASAARTREDSAKDDTAAVGQRFIPAPAPTRSVWNGRHDALIVVASTPVPGSEASSVASVPARSPSPSIASTRSIDSNSKTVAVVVSLAPKDDIKALQPLVPEHVKEDETTNSTAGSSRSSATNSTAIMANGPALEVDVVTTTVTLPNKKGAMDDDTPSGCINKSNSTTVSSDASPVNSHISNKKQNNGQARITPFYQGLGAGYGNTANDGNARRMANKGRTSKNNNKNSGNNNNHGRNFSRGNSIESSARRRAISACTSDKPVCTFFLRGMCNRGIACAFKHDPAQAHLPLSDSPGRSISHPAAGNKVKGLSRGGNGNFMQAKRVFDPYKARAIQLAKEAQDKEDRSLYTSIAKIIKGNDDGEDPRPDPPFFSVDVECIATGYGSCAKGINDGCGNGGSEGEGVPSFQYNERSHRYPGRVAMVDSEGILLADMLIRPPNDGAGVVSYLTPLTGLNCEMCLGPDAKNLEEAVDVIRGLLPKNGILVGQAIDHDVEWLGLVEGRDFGRMIDISTIFRQRIPAVLGHAAGVLKRREAEDVGERMSSDSSSDEALGFPTRYRHFSLRHVCLNLLGTDIQAGVHDPSVDAHYSLTLFRKYRDSSVTQLRIVRDGLHRAPITPGFAAENTPVIDGVCLSAAGYPYKRAARKIWRFYSLMRQAS